jgi:hypothetical protein
MSDELFIDGKPIRKIAAWVPVSEEQLAALRPPTADEQRQYVSRREARQREVAAQLAQHEALVQQATGLRKAVLELHGLREDYGSLECEGCDFAGYEGEPAEWPCRTYELARDFQDEN